MGAFGVTAEGEFNFEVQRGALKAYPEGADARRCIASAVISIGTTRGRDNHQSEMGSFKCPFTAVSDLFLMVRWAKGVRCIVSPLASRFSRKSVFNGFFSITKGIVYVRVFSQTGEERPLRRGNIVRSSKVALGNRGYGRQVNSPGLPARWSDGLRVDSRAIE